MNLDKQSIDTATEAALECALWTGLKYPPQHTGHVMPLTGAWYCDTCNSPLCELADEEPIELEQAGYGIDDYTQEARAHMRSMILSFTRAVTSELCLDIASIPADSFGHDFVLTAQGHGAGYWDRGYGTLGDALTRFAKTYNVDVYVTRLDNLGIEA